jgi:hypothetical protein
MEEPVTIAILQQLAGNRATAAKLVPIAARRWSDLGVDVGDADDDVDADGAAGAQPAADHRPHDGDGDSSMRIGVGARTRWFKRRGRRAITHVCNAGVMIGQVVHVATSEVIRVGPVAPVPQNRAVARLTAVLE